MLKKKTILFCILDGWGIGPQSKYNSIYQAKTPCWDSVWKKVPYTTLKASEKAVGLPVGQMGNSEVGHTNIGAGRIVEQILPKIDRVLEGNNIHYPEKIKEIFSSLKSQKGTLHLFGIISDGKVHGSYQHIVALAKHAQEENIPVMIHGMADGRDCAPRKVWKYMQAMQEEIPHLPLTSLIGRYYAMDRDNRWERTELAWKLWQHGSGKYIPYKDFPDYLSREYISVESDEFLPPIKFNDNYLGFGENDIFVMNNFRIDRMKQIMQSLTAQNFDKFLRENFVSPKHIYTMVPYGDNFPNTTPIFTRDNVPIPLGEVISNAGLKQLRIAETEKFPHVSYFFNGGKETPFPREERCLVPSPKVASYDLAPEMSANSIGDKVLDAIKSENYSLIVVNFANPDMVGHTGKLKAACKGVQCVDQQMQRILQVAQKHNVCTLISADHGNAEIMWDEKANMPHTAHTTNPVPFLLIDPERPSVKLRKGVLGDIAPTILEILQLDKPAEMTGISLFED